MAILYKLIGTAQIDSASRSDALCFSLVADLMRSCVGNLVVSVVVVVNTYAGVGVAVLSLSLSCKEL